MLVGLEGGRAIVLWWTLPAYTTIIGAALLVSAAVLLWVTRASWRASSAFNSFLLAAALGLVFARLQHVLTNWEYFGVETGEVLSLSSGGLDAHGAVLGAALGAALASRYYRTTLRIWLGAASYVMPVVAFACWWGCSAVGCNYGAELPNLTDAPAWLVWEASGDFLTVAPRYAVQPLAMVSCAGMLAAVGVLARLGVGGVRRAALTLLGITLTGAVLSPLRGDLGAGGYASSISAVFDAAVIGLSLAIAMVPRRKGVPAT